MTPEKPLNTIALLQHINGGRFLEHMDAVLAEVGAETASYGRAGADGKGQIVLTFDFVRVDDERQLKTLVKLTFSQPKPNQGGLKGFSRFATRLYAKINGTLALLNPVQQGEIFTITKTTV